MVTLWAVHSCARLQRVASAARLSPCTWWRGGRVARRLHCRRQAARLAFFSLWPFACPVSLPLFLHPPRLRAFCSAFFEFPFLVAFWREVFCKRVASVEYRGVPAIWEEALRRAGSCLSVLCLPLWGTGFGILVFWRGGVRGRVWALFLCWFVFFSPVRLPHLSLLLAVICAVAGVQSTLSVSRRGAGSAFGFSLL